MILQKKYAIIKQLFTQKGAYMKNKNRKNKIASIAAAAMLPVSAFGVASVMSPNFANAEAANVSYSKSVVKELSMTNSNFSSSTSTYSLSTSLSGWTGQKTDKKTTAGIINTGASFNQNMGNFYLSKNPLTKAGDKYILMINSQTDNTSKLNLANQGYKSSTINLAANSYYMLQTSFKSDTCYEKTVKYQDAGIITDAKTISKTTFNGGSNTNITAFGDDTYISFYHQNKYYYLKKSLTADGTTDTNLENLETFYEDDKYYGVINTDGKTFYVEKNKDNVTASGENSGKVNIIAGTQKYTCDIVYNTTDKNFDITGLKYYEKTDSYVQISSFPFGSIYLSGLVDENGNAVKAEFVKVSSQDWVTFYFFVATGNTAQNVSLDLWLGSQQLQSSGVVFYDDCHLTQYSANAFWKTYKSYQSKHFTQTVIDDDNLQDKETAQTNFVDLRNDTSLAYDNLNLNFEAGTYNDTTVKNWTINERAGGNAMVFDTNTTPSYFKAATGYNYVGSNLSCYITFNGEKVNVINENKYALALWANNNFSEVTSGDLEIEANQIYKIKAFFKVSELKNGNAYISVKENNKVLSTYHLSEADYKLAEQTYSSALSANSSDEFANAYSTVEFYVKGGSLYNSSVNLSLSVGKSGETATGCVLFDDITITKASSESFSSATNKVELGTTDKTPTIANGNFDKVTVSSSSTAPYAPENWTISGGKNTYGGVINTQKDQFQKYIDQKLENEKHTATKGENNPYLWATSNPKNTFNKEDADNVLMLANLNNSWQTLKSDAISLSANTTHKISFKYKNMLGDFNSSFTVSVYGEDGFKLFTSKELNSNNQWLEYEIYFKALSGENKVYLQFDFGTEKDPKIGQLFLDNFTLTSENVTAPKDSNVVDMTDFYLNIGTNEITGDLNTSHSPAYSGSVSSGEAKNMSGTVVLSEAFANSDSKFTIYTDETEQEIDKTQKVFFLQTKDKGSYVLQSNFNLDMEANGYYALSFKLKTHFNDQNIKDNKKYSYGAMVGLTGFDLMTELKSAEEYSLYTMYFKPAEAASAKLYMAISCDEDISGGSFAIYDFNFDTCTEEDYNNAVSVADGGNFDVNKDKVFVSKATDTEDTDTPDTDNKPTETSPNNFNWIMIPSLIFGLAIVVAIVGFLLRKVKIKKIERKHRESYDRKTSLNANVIKQKAAAKQQEEIAKLQNVADKFAEELKNIEQAHKQKILAMREKDGEKVSKETDKEFKQFAAKRTVIAEKIELLNKQIADMKTPEYLLNLERKIYAQDEMKRRELEKQSKRQQKQQDK